MTAEGPAPVSHPLPGSVWRHVATGAVARVEAQCLGRQPGNIWAEGVLYRDECGLLRWMSRAAWSLQYREGA